MSCSCLFVRCYWWHDMDDVDVDDDCLWSFMIVSHRSESQQTTSLRCLYACHRGRRWLLYILHACINPSIYDTVSSRISINIDSLVFTRHVKNAHTDTVHISQRLPFLVPFPLLICLCWLCFVSFFILFNRRTFCLFSICILFVLKR